MAGTRNEVAAFKKLSKANIGGDNHESRMLTISIKTWGPPEYGAYIAGLSDDSIGFYGWTYARTPMEAVDLCIAKALEVEVNRLIEEKRTSE